MAKKPTPRRAELQLACDAAVRCVTAALNAPFTFVSPTLCKLAREDYPAYVATIDKTFAEMQRLLGEFNRHFTAEIAQTVLNATNHFEPLVVNEFTFQTAFDAARQSLQWFLNLVPDWETYKSLPTTAKSAKKRLELARKVERTLAHQIKDVAWPADGAIVVRLDREMSATIKSIGEDEVPEYLDLTLDSDNHTVGRKGDEIELPSKSCWPVFKKVFGKKGEPLSARERAALPGSNEIDARRQLRRSINQEISTLKIEITKDWRLTEKSVSKFSR